MPKVKNTARKSTSGPAKREKTTGGPSVFRPFGTTSLSPPSTLTPSTPIPTLPLTPTVVSIKTPSSEKSDPHTQTFQDSKVGGILSAILGDGETLEPDNEHWCSLCHDGSTLLVACWKCRRQNCSQCIPGLEKFDEKTLDGLVYMCPPCHGRRSVFYGLFRDGEPVFPKGMEIAERAVVTHGARMNAAPLAIVELHLATLSEDGTPAVLLHNFLKATFTPNPKDLGFFHRSFNIDGDEGLKSHRSKMKGLVTKLKKENFDRVVLFINTHSDADRGDLFYYGGVPGEESASTNVAQFFNEVVGKELREYISEREYSLVFLGTCGSVVNVHKSFEELRGIVQEWQISDAFAFTKPCLDLQSTILFVLEFVDKVLITGHKTASILPKVVNSTPTIRTTGIVHLSSAGEGKVEAGRYVLDDPASSPGGHNLPPQCKKCRCYKSWKVPKSRKKSGDLVIRCGTPDCSGFLQIPKALGNQRTFKDNARLCLLNI